MVITGLRDSVAGRFLGIQLAQNNEDATRGVRQAFTSAADNPDSLLYFSPGDFDLYYLGTFDEHTGAIDGLEDYRIIYKGADFLSGADCE